MKAVTRVYLYGDGNDRFFGEGPCRLLRAVERTGSLRAAAGSMGLAYTKALKLLRRAEEVLGWPLTETAVGGKGGGGSRLTDRGRELLGRYERYRDACYRANEELFREFFPAWSPVGCVVMASGEGRRFQTPGAPYRNKLLADFQGAPLMGRILDLTDGLPLAARTVVTRSGEAAAYCRGRGVDVLLHGLPHRSDTVRLGLLRAEELSGRSLAGCMFCPADQPLLRRESVAALLDSFAGAPERIHRLGLGDRPGNPVIFPRRLFPELERLPEGAGGSWLIQKYPEQVVWTPVREEAELLDADTGEELERLAAMSRERSEPPCDDRYSALEGRRDGGAADISCGCEQRVPLLGGGPAGGQGGG